ncbi:MAG: hypothetical protein EBQ76_03690 [Betaproteobacteria bacterium]|nr:hypothetical protein [Betaproteobacteria bacterium]NDF04365.1 hypothetical protein [Betaproteobacteria bacterium]
MAAAQKVIVVLCMAGPRNPAAAATALVYAQTARALDAVVEVHLTGESVRLAFRGEAASLYSDSKREHSIQSFFERCHEMGIKLYVCGMAMQEHHHGEALIPEVQGVAGTTSVLGQMLHEGARVLTF